MKGKRVKIIERVVGTIVLGLVLIGCKNVLDFLYVNEDDWYRIFWHHYYEDEGKIDSICLGSSHVYTNIDPYVLDELSGQYNFNMATSGQMANGSYYLLQEANSGNDISHVYFELYYRYLTKETYHDNGDPLENEEYFSHNWQNTDYMNCSLNKLKYLSSFISEENYVDVLIPFTRYRSTLGNWSRIKANIDKKSSDMYKEYRWQAKRAVGGNLEYRDRGYCYLDGELLEEERLFKQDKILEDNPLAIESEKYIRKIILYCQKENIPITLFVAPMDNLQLASTENYDNYVEQIREIASEYGVEFYDFNLVKDEYLPTWDGTLFNDAGHLNATGADQFTRFFYKVVSGESAENERYFYDSYAERLNSMEPQLFGLYYQETENGDRKYTVASNREDMEYKITLIPSNEEEKQYVIQDFSESRTFAISNMEHGICRIEARMMDDTVVIDTMEVKY